MGRSRQPASLLEAKNSFLKHPERRRTGEPIPLEGDLVRPEFLKGRAAELFDEISILCAAMGTAAHGDEWELATWCVLEAEFEENPRKMFTSRLALKRSCAERFGMAGAGSRAKLAADPKERKDPAEKYFEAEKQQPN
jgi:hypothetical protein